MNYDKFVTTMLIITAPITVPGVLLFCSIFKIAEIVCTPVPH